MTGGKVAIEIRKSYFAFYLLKGVAEAIEHCTQTQVKLTVVTAIYALEMAASAKAGLTFRIGLCRTS